MELFREITRIHIIKSPHDGVLPRKEYFMENYNAREGKPQPLRISPRAYALAVQYDVNLYQVKPTGPEGRIIERDIRAAIGIIIEDDEPAAVSAPAEDASIEEAPVEDAPTEDTPVEEAPTEETPIEETAIVAAPVVSISKTEEDETEEDTPKAETNKLYGYTDVIIPRTPHDSLEFKTLTLGVSFDATAIMNLRASIKENGKHMGTENITINDMILFATAKVLRKFKALNAHFLEDRIRYFDNVHLGIAVDTPEGLKKPTVFDANKLSLSALSKLTKLIIADAEENGSEAEKWEGASFTVSNLGSHGIESFTPVLMAPQTGVLGVCASAKRIKEENGEAVFYSAIPLSLTFDTRALDSTSAAKFLRELVFALENFELLLLK